MTKEVEHNYNHSIWKERTEKKILQKLSTCFLFSHSMAASGINGWTWSLFYFIIINITFIQCSFVFHVWKRIQKMRIFVRKYDGFHSRKRKKKENTNLSRCFRAKIKSIATKNVQCTRFKRVDTIHWRIVLASKASVLWLFV